MPSAKPKLVIFGSGQIAEIAHFYWTHDSDYEVAAFTVDRAYLTQDSLFGLPVMAFEEVAAKFPPSDYAMFVAMGFNQVNKQRADTLSRVEALGYRCPSYISSRAITWPGFTCGPNCFVMELNNIQPFARLGKNVTLWSGNHIGHHTVIGDHCFIASHVVVSGSVAIGDYSFIGVNAAIRDNISIGRVNVIGAGCTILKSTGDDQVFRATAAEPMALSSQHLNKL